MKRNSIIALRVVQIAILVVLMFYFSKAFQPASRSLAVLSSEVERQCPGAVIEDVGKVDPDSPQVLVTCNGHGKILRLPEMPQNISYWSWGRIALFWLAFLFVIFMLFSWGIPSQRIKLFRRIYGGDWYYTEWSKWSRKKDNFMPLEKEEHWGKETFLAAWFFKNSPTGFFEG